MSYARQVPDHGRLTPYLRPHRPPYRAPLVLYLNSTLQGCYQVLERRARRYYEALSQPHNHPKPTATRPTSPSTRSTQPTSGAAASVCASAHFARRVAAAYGNAREQISGSSHLISPRSKSYPGLSSRLTWHDFVISRFHTFPHSPPLGHRCL